jgi:hypothetical protein
MMRNVGRTKFPHLNCAYTNIKSFKKLLYWWTSVLSKPTTDWNVYFWRYWLGVIGIWFLGETIRYSMCYCIESNSYEPLCWRCALGIFDQGRYHFIILMPSTNPCVSVFLEKLISQLINKFPAFYKTWRCNTVYTKAGHYYLTCARWIQPTSSHPISWRLVLLLSMNLPYRDPLYSTFHIACPYCVT